MSLDHIDQGVAYLAEATAIASASGNPILLVTVLGPHALLANLTGRPERAATLAGASSRLEREYDVNLPEVGRALFGAPAEGARAALGDEGFERARSAGQTMTLTKMIERSANETA